MNWIIRLCQSCLFLGVLSLALAGTAPALETGRNPDERQTAGIRTYASQFLPDLRAGTGRIFSRDNLPLALFSAGLAGIAAAGEHRIDEYFRDREPLGSSSRTGSRAGSYGYHLAAGAAFVTAGELWDNWKLADTGIVALESLFVNALMTEGLSYASKRVNPGSRRSFPSAYASSSAALAASISSMYDWDLKLSIPLYAAVLYAGFSGIQEDRHSLSGMAAGLALGTIVGKSFAALHKEKNQGIRLSRKLSFTPLFGKEVKGGLFTMKW